MTTCCSTKCEKRHECKKHCFNNIGCYPSEDFYSFGSGSISTEGYKDTYWCGELGDYKMFEPIKENNTLKDYIEYKGKMYQVSTVEISGLFETMIFPVDNGVVSGYEIYCYKASDLFMAKYKHQEILHYPESFVSSEAKLQYLKSKEEYFETEIIPQFPFQYMDKYLNGEVEYNEAVNQTMEEAKRLIKEYVKKNK